MNKENAIPSLTAASPAAEAAPLFSFRLPVWISRSLDFILIPYLIIFFSYEPNAANGFVNYLESGQYLSVINAIFHGQALYRDIYLFFGPLSYWGPALAMLAFGKTLAVLRHYFLIGDISTFLILYFLCRLVIRNRFLAYLAGIIIVMQAHNPFWCSRWGGFRFAAAYAAIAALALLMKSRSRFFGWLGGFLTGTALLHSVDMGILSLVCAISLFAADKLLPGRTKEESLPSHSFFIYVFGFLSALIPFFLYVGISGTVGPFLRDMASLTHRGVWAQRPDFSGRNIVKVFFPVFAYVCASWVGFRRNRFERLYTTLFVSFGFLFYVYSFRSIEAGPQFETSLPFCILASFYCLSQFFERPFFLRKAQVPEIVIATSLAAGILFIAVVSPNYFYGNNFGNWVGYQKDKAHLFPLYKGADQNPQRSVDDSIQRMKGSKVPEWQAAEIEKVTDLIRTYSGDTEALFAFPDLAFFNFVTDRRAINRYSVPGFVYEEKDGEQLLIASLKAERPPVILMPSKLSVLSVSLHRNEELFPGVVEFVNKNYSLRQKTEHVSVYIQQMITAPNLRTKRIPQGLR